MSMAAVQPREGRRSLDPDQHPPDPRMEAFADWLQSLDRRDWRAGVESQRRLRRMGISICTTQAG
jgi:hypothetical protein